MGLKDELARSEAVGHFCSRTDLVTGWRGFAVTPLMAWALDMNAKAPVQPIERRVGGQ
jgi:hypothetical protein